MSYKELDDLDGQWQASDDMVRAIRDVKNLKNVKYGDRLFDQFAGKEEELNPSTWSSATGSDTDRNLYRTTLTAKCVKEIHQIKKMTKSNQVDLYSGEDTPLVVVFYRKEDGEADYRGAYLVAPRISEGR